MRESASKLSRPARPNACALRCGRIVAHAPGGLDCFPTNLRAIATPHLPGLGKVYGHLSHFNLVLPSLDNNGTSHLLLVGNVALRVRFLSHTGPSCPGIGGRV